MFRQFAASIALLSFTSAYAAGPMVTQSADVMDRGDCRGEAQWQRSQASNDWGRVDASVRSVELACGVGWGTQMALSGTWGKWSSPQFLILPSRADGRSLSSKTRLWQSETGAGALALTVVLGEERRDDLQTGMGAPVTQRNRALGLAYSQTLGERHRVHANLMSDVVGFGSSEKAEAWGLAYEFAATPTVSLLAETHGKQHIKPTQALGLRWTPTANWELGAMAARPRGENGNGAKSHEVKLSTAYRF